MDLVTPCLITEKLKGCLYTLNTIQNIYVKPKSIV